jgi:hypothetical protein
MPDPQETAGSYRQYASKCLEIAQNISDIDRRLFLLNMAQDWLKLAEQVEQDLTPVTPYQACSREFQLKKP